MAKPKKEELYKYLLRIGDNALVLGQRLSEWCGHGPVLEQDIAITNISLDLIGQTRNWFQYAAQVDGRGQDEDDIAFLRDAWDFHNLLLVEQPNRDWAHTMVRQFIFDAFHYYFIQSLTESKDKQIAAIAEKSLKEIAYHLKYSSEWVIRLGDGTDVSHQKMQDAVDNLWMFTGELTEPDELDGLMAKSGIGVDPQDIRPAIEAKLTRVLEEATLTIPRVAWMQRGGKQGIHTEHLGHLLAEMQFMQRAYPGLEW